MDDLFEHMMESDRDRAINGFYKHFLIYAAVIAVLAIINIASGDAFWIHWVALGWGLGLGLHAFIVFVRKPQQEAKMRELRDARKAARESRTDGQTPGTAA
jgi:2TM domain-containing protein